MEDNVKLVLWSRQLMPSQSTERKKSWHSQTRLVCDRCCALNRAIVTTCPEWKLALVYPSIRTNSWMLFVRIHGLCFTQICILMFPYRWYLVTFRINNTLEIVRIPDEEPQPSSFTVRKSFGLSSGLAQVTCRDLSC